MEQESWYQPNSLQESRRHISAKSLGIDLPPGYHVLETRFRLLLCFGETDVRAYSIGTDPKQLERDAARHAARQRASRPEPAMTAPSAEDPLTGLPWTHAVTADAAQMACESDLHVVCIRLTGLDILIETQGYRSSQTVLRHATQALKPYLRANDRLTRHSGDKLMIFTTRSLQDVETLVDTIHQEVATVAATVGASGLPQSQIGVASLPREEDANEATALIEALVISAEAASTAIESQDTSAESLVERDEAFAEIERREAKVEPSTLRDEVFAEIGRQTQVEASTVQDEVFAQMSTVPSAAEPSESRVPLEAAAVEVETGYPDMYISKPAPETFGETLPSADAEATTSVRIQPTEEPLTVSPQEAAMLQASPTTLSPEPEATAPAPRPVVVEPMPAAPLSEGIRIIDNTKRLILKSVNLDVSGQVATATVQLTLGDRRVMGKAVGRDTEDRRLYLVAEATARAITEFMPRGYGAILHHIQHAPAEVGVALWSLVILLTPTGEQSLLGIALADGNLPEAAANSVLNATNRRVGVLLSESN